MNSVKELDGASVCVAQGTTTELNLADYGRTNGIKFETVAFATLEDTVQAYEAGRCDAYTTDLSSLAGTRGKLKNPEEHILLQQVISKEPLGPGSARTTRPGSTSSAGPSSRRSMPRSSA